MTDIVERLYQHVKEQISDAVVGKALCKEAVTELERLQVRQESLEDIINTAITAALALDKQVGAELIRYRTKALKEQT